MPGILAAIVVAIAAIDCAWQAKAHFDLDVAAYSRIALLTLGLAAGGLFYGRVRNAPNLAAMFYGTAFLVGFSASLSVLNYFLLTVAHLRIDFLLARIDIALGVNWPAMVSGFVGYPVVNWVLRLAYVSVLPQVALLVIWLGWKSRTADIYAFCLALACGAIVTVGFWTAFPSFGAFSVYELPAAVSHRLNLALDSEYAHELVGLLLNGPGRITPDQVKGLIGFPSFHATMALLVVWHSRSSRVLFWPLLAWNAAVLVATPIHGGHHIVDVFGGMAVAAAAVALSAGVARKIGSSRPLPTAWAESPVRAAGSS